MKNVMALFESRINDIFSHTSASSSPIQFKRLAKKTVREMENETFVIDGIDTAPALYTILVSSEDDQVMRPLYVEITEEVSSLVEAQAKRRGYSFVGKPLVRFMIDPSLKQGKYAVFAENIDPRTLARLRDEENAFLGLTPQPTYTADDADDAGLTRIPEDMAPSTDEQVAQPEAPQTPEPIAAEAPEPEPQKEGEGEPVAAEPAQESPASLADDGASPAEEAPEAEAQASDPVDHDEPAVAEVAQTPAPTPEAVPAPQASEPTPTVAHPAEPAGDADSTGEISTRAPRHVAVPEAHPTCTLTDQQSGRVYTISADRTPIGRERVEGGIVLRDPNVSRKHAELTYDGHEWHITDLHSTNGTLVNDIDIDECSLRDGDVLTIGLLNFVFREN